MTMRTKTLTAVAALSIFAGSYALAQEGATTAPAETEAPAEVEATTPPAAEPATDGAAAEEQPSDVAEPVVNEVPAAEPAADAAEDDATAEGTAEPTAEAAGEAPAEDAEAAPAESEAAEEPAADAPAEESTGDEAAPAEAEEAAPADDAAAEEPAADAPATEAAPENAAAEEAPAEASAEGEAAPAEEAAAEEAPAEAEADAHAAEGGEEAEEGGHGGGHIEDINFSFEGPFGKYDQFQLQRGLQVYTEVCSACHGMKFVPIRTLHDEGGPGLPEDQVRAYAQNLTIIDKETGEERPREPTDHFPTVSGEGMGPDLSLMAKARAGFHGPAGTGLNQLVKGIGGPEYIHAILTGYTGEEKTQAGTTLYGNEAFDTGFLSMPPPLSEGLVTYEDGTEATVDQMARDVSAFLMWTAEPKMMARKQVGLVAVLFLIVLTGLLYMTNKKLWAPHKGKKPE